ncbi:MAG: hypothetical protein DIU60_015445, partial [Actinomycetes bacterium]
MRRPRNLAATIGGWSARHRWAAILVWIAFVAVATVAGNTVGTVGMRPYEGLNGDSRAAEEILDGAGFPEVTAETVLVQRRDDRLTVDDERFRAAVDAVRRAVLATGEAENVRTPYDTPPAPVTADRGTALVQFTMKGDAETAADRVGKVLDAVADVQRRFPDLRIAQAGAA